MEYSSTSTSESDSTLCEKLNQGQIRKRKYKNAKLKRNPREGMCLLSGDEKPSKEEENIISISSDDELANIPSDILSDSNLVSLEDGDEDLEKSMMEIDI